MDDYNTSMLSEAKNEYCIRLLNILTPLLIEGLKSILKEAHNLCISNDEESKYLMTFQNFLSRIPKWNNAIIEEETNRIIAKSGCKYLGDLLTCVHITQLKVLTSIRVGSVQKKIDLAIPKLQDFIHKIYIKFARKLYKNVYLFELNIPPLQYQKSMRECETLCRESILDVIRDSIPVESILRAYIDDTFEEEIVEEITEKVLDDKPQDVSGQIVEEKGKKEFVGIKKVEEKPEVKEVMAEKAVAEKAVVEKAVVEKAVAEKAVAEKAVAEKAVAEKAVVEKKELQKTLQELLEDSKDNIKKEKGLTFSDTDIAYDKETMTPKKVEAPKDIERLEKISAKAHNKRKEEEEEDEETLTIFRDAPSIKLDSGDIHDLNKPINLKPPPIISVETLT